MLKLISATILSLSMLTGIALVRGVSNCPQVLLCLPGVWLNFYIFRTGGFSIEIHLPTGPIPRTQDELWNNAVLWGDMVFRPYYMAVLWWSIPQKPREWFGDWWKVGAH